MKNHQCFKLVVKLEMNELLGKLIECCLKFLMRPMYFCEIFVINSDITLR